MHEAGDVLNRDRQVAQDLQNADRLGDVLVQLRVREADLYFAHRLVKRQVAFFDVFFQCIEQRHRGGQPSHRLIGNGGTVVSTLYQYILDHLNGRTQADTASGFRQSAQQMQQDIEVRWQERVKINKGLLVKIGAVGAGINQLGVVA